ncbi:terpenoid synthase [Neolentinus lepideus HHB14362 ss-1]|uniref:Terpene synthase n=1 Tax=Neolentinus lepideus HHB14362 ss-1 TaxID=1314782 RepID=A0A165TXS5_9AGAM|nr:terpenoid synthase [Neolentinus lepideus HHB14362 ss-1]
MTVMSSTRFPNDSTEPDHFILPDLVGHCTFPLTYHPNGDAIAAQSVRWLDQMCPELTPKKRKALYGLQAGELTAQCYPYSITEDRLRVVSDFMNYLFHLDNISDGMMTHDTERLADTVMNALWYPHEYNPTHTPGKEQPDEEINAGKIARDYWARCIQEAGPGVQARFKESLSFFFEAVHKQAQDRDADIIPDIESYIDVRRDTSGCKPVFDLMEYALGIDLPDYVVEHPVIKALNQGTNDLVTWSNDIFSYNVEQARGDTHNMVVILMKYHNHTLQSAIDYVGGLCRETINTFIENKTKVPSWGPEVDKDVAGYVHGLQEWIVGSLHWSFQTKRYFQDRGAEVKRTRYVKLLPLKAEAGSVPLPVSAPTKEAGLFAKFETKEAPSTPSGFEFYKNIFWSLFRVIRSSFFSWN